MSSSSLSSSALAELFDVLMGKFESESEVAQSCPTLCEPMDYCLPGFSIHGIFQARIPEWVAFSSLQGIFSTQGLNLGPPHCRQTLYPLSPQGREAGKFTETYLLLWWEAYQARPHQ